ncbi:N-acetylmuramoyl-L-alanine amidase [Anaerovorax odorimutans]|uniref:N-acetylmuramoyl-L-alanine amidase n=1 Tax=Anaerovorax odorimutans TaxID=109327 RepID=UPI00040C8FE3|nr:N-acetylmuramoyl-L-alanine amidase [Anaerovorax odorimutans]
MKKIFILFIAVLFFSVFNIDGVFASDDVTQEEIQSGIEVCREFPVGLNLDGSVINTETPPIIIKERTMIPARAFFETMGATVGWNEEQQEVTVNLGSSYVTLKINMDKAVVDGVSKDLELPALIIDTDGDGYGSTMIPLRFVADSLNCNVEWDELNRIASVNSPNTNNVIVPVNSTNVEIISTSTAISDTTTSEAVNTNDSAGINDKITTKQGITVNNLPSLDDRLKQKLIVIDAGHGGSDPGALGEVNGNVVLTEKEVNLDIALKLNSYLKSVGASTYLLRESDVSIGLQDRPKMANSVNGYLYVSIHNNSAISSSVNGTEVYYYSKQSEANYGIYSQNLAQAILDEMVVNMGLKNRGIKSQPAYAVLNKTNMPAIIIEGAFLSNNDNLQYMLTDEFRDKFAYSAAKGIIKVLNESINN